MLYRLERYASYVRTSNLSCIWNTPLSLPVALSLEIQWNILLQGTIEEGDESAHTHPNKTADICYTVLPGVGAGYLSSPERYAPNTTCTQYLYVSVFRSKVDDTYLLM